MTDQKYNGLREKLQDTKFPSLYMFKFIILNDISLLAQVEKLTFDPTTISSKLSKNGKYISITIKEYKNSIDEIIDVYMKAEEIEGIISL